MDSFRSEQNVRSNGSTPRKSKRSDSSAFDSVIPDSIPAPSNLVSSLPQNQKVLDYISNSLQTLDFTPVSSRNVLGETSQNRLVSNRDESLPQPSPLEGAKVAAVSKEHSALLENLRQKSLDIQKKTSAWEEKFRDIAQKRDKIAAESVEKIGAQNLDALCATLEPEKEQQLEQQNQQQRLDKQQQQYETSIVESTSSVENRKPAKPVKFIRRTAEPPDELNMIDLMYQKELKHRKEAKMAKSKKRKKQKSSFSAVSSKESSLIETNSTSAVTPVLVAAVDETDQSTDDRTISSYTPVVATSAKSTSESVQDKVRNHWFALFDLTNHNVMMCTVIVITVL